MFELVQYYPMQSNISTKDKTEFPKRIHLPQCQSTNDEMQGILAENKDFLPEGFILSTDFQSAGRGQRGSQWISEPGQNLLFSLLLRPDFLEARFAFRLSATVALGIAKALEKQIPGLKLKWPNDLYAGDRKLGGMLIETVLSGQRIDRAICGIGLNINQKELPPQAVSFREITGEEGSRETLLADIHASIMEQYQLLKSGQWPAIRSAYLSRLYRLAIPAWYQLPDGTRFQALLKSIGEQGELILLCKDGEKTFQFKDVAFEI
jgi:BirA family biotin operon repressor/biotin-[acetyl-CoA-carboxylase] ligase